MEFSVQPWVNGVRASAPHWGINTPISDFLCQFLENVDESNVKNKIDFGQRLAVTEQLVKLTEGITLLDKELQKQVLEKHEDLISQATWVEKLQSVLSVMHIHVQSLLSSVERVRMKVVEPFSRLETQTVVLSRLHATSDLLRRAVRIHQLTKRLPGQEALRAAHIISEIDELYRDVDLSGLEILEGEQRLIKRETTRVEQQALKIVEQGLMALNNSQVSTGLEIFIRLGIIDREINKLMKNGLEQVEQNLQYALDMNNLVPTSIRVGGAGRATGVNIPGNIQNFRSKLWAAWDSLLNSTVYTTCAQMVVVQDVLNSKGGHNYGNYGIGGTTDQISEVASIFWSQVDNLLTDELLRAAKGSSYMKQAFEGEYPKLLRIHLDLHKKLKALDQTDTSGKPIFQDMGKSCRQFETAYLSRSLMLVLDSVREMFPEGDSSSTIAPPSVDRIDALIKTISNELSVSLVDEALTKPVARNVAKAVSLFCQKGEQMLVTGPEATQVIESPTAGQELNVNIANVVFYFCEQTRQVISNLGLSKQMSANITTALEGGQLLIKQILNPLIASITEAIEAILLTMHNEDFSMNDKTTSSNSLYMKELQKFISRAVTTYLVTFHSQQLVAQACISIASRTIELFLRNASLVRPLSDGGRKKLISDFKSVEDAVSPLCSQLSELGPVYSTLRSLKPLMLATAQEVATSPVLGQVIPYSLAITTLFSRGPPQLPSPHQSVGWSVAKLSEWLDKHTNERDRLELISGALQKYQQTVCNENQSSYDPVFPVMTQLLDKATHHLSL